MKIENNRRNGNFTIFTTALEYIEENLGEEFSQEDIARECCCSLSTLQKLWRYCTHMSIKEYITKRRMTCAGRDLLNTDINVLDIAVKYGYNSHEVFTRAFSKVWGMSPTAFKNNWKGYCGLCPKINPSFIEGDEYINMKKFDISELFDYVNDRVETYVMCFDITGLHAVNTDISREAGDKMILETLKRIAEVCTDDMIALRIGGDEFVILSGLDSKEKVEALGKKVLSKNGEIVKYSKGEVPLSLRAGAFKIKKPLKYSGVCHDFEIVMDKARSSGEIEFA